MQDTQSYRGSLAPSHERSSLAPSGTSQHHNSPIKFGGKGGTPSTDKSDKSRSESSPSSASSARLGYGEHSGIHAEVPTIHEDAEAEQPLDLSTE